MSEKPYKFVIIKHLAEGIEDIFPYQTDDEDVDGFVCFENFAEAKHFYLECLQVKVDKALKLKIKDIK
jgi:hypothetical protein